MTGLDIGIADIVDAVIVGAGGNATVYRARDTTFDREVAIKVLRPTGDERDRVRFDRERKAMGRAAGHPSIVDVYSSGWTRSGQPYIVMPYYSGGSIADELRHGAFTLERAREVLLPIASGLAHAHDLGIVHRDIKPANILVDAENRPVITDFGIAKLGVEMSTTAVTMTPLYSAPEIFDGAAPSVASDVYSLGALGYAILAGRPAFGDDDSSVMAVMRSVTNNDAPPLPDAIPRPVDAVIKRAMHKDPTQRYASAREFAAALAEVFPGSTGSSSGAAATIARPDEAALPAALPFASPDQSAEIANRDQTARGKRSIPFVLAALAIGVLAAAVLAVLSNSDEGPLEVVAEVIPTGLATPSATTSSLPTPAATPVIPSDTAMPGTLAQAMAQHGDAVYRVESFACRQLRASQGIQIGRDLLVVSERVASDWSFRVVGVDGADRGAPQFARVTRVVDGTNLALLSAPGTGAGPAQSRLVDALRSDETMTSRVVSAVSMDGEEAVGLLRTDDSGRQVIANAEAGAVVWTQDGAFAGLVGADGEVLSPRDLSAAATLETTAGVSPRSCSADEQGDLSGQATVSSDDEVMGSLVQAQALATALATQDWEAVRDIEPSRQSYSDDDLEDGWGALVQASLVPVEVVVDGDDLLWRVGLVGHERLDGEEITVGFCVTWRVSTVTDTVTQTPQDPVILADQVSPFEGWLDPTSLRDEILRACRTRDNPLEAVNTFVSAASRADFAQAVGLVDRSCPAVGVSQVDAALWGVQSRFRLLSLTENDEFVDPSSTIRVEVRLPASVELFEFELIRPDGSWRICSLRSIEGS